MSWLGLASPAWLVGLAALAVPVAIHLLSRGRQRRVEVGSVRWLAPVETLRARQIRISRWWLLALRCALLALLALALAGPRLGLAGRDEVAPWVLVSPEAESQRAALEAGNEAAYRALDAALAAGGELHWLAPGALESAAIRPPEVVSSDLWSLLRQADALAPARARFVVVALDRQAELSGARPTLGREVAWHGVVDRRANRWIERAVAGGGGRLALVVGESDDAGMRFTGSEVDAGAVASGLRVDPGDEGWRLSLVDGGSQAFDDSLQVPAAARALEVALLASGERREDARYVEAALAAAAEAAAQALDLRRVEEGGDSGAAGLVFWLAAEPVPPRLLEGLAAGAVLVSDASGRFESCGEQLWLGNGPALWIDRCGELEEGGGAAAPMWEGASGRPLLVAERVGAGRWLRFASRFHPAWGGLVSSPQFPNWILELVALAAPAPLSARHVASDRRSAGGQGAPARGEAASAAGGELSLGPWLLLCVLALAAGERWLARRSAA